MRFLLTLLILTGVSAFNNAQDTQPAVVGGTLYALPQTTIRIEIKAVVRQTFAGPYADYSEAYLGIKPLVTTDGYQSAIADIKVTAIHGADPDNYFRVNIPQNHPVWGQIAALSAEGLITKPDATIDPFVFKNINIPDNDRIIFRDLSIHGMFTERSDTTYKTETRDTTFVRIPVVKKVVVAKTTEEKAREAADFIFKLRKRKSKLITGQYEVMPDGAAIEALVPEVDRIEQEYLSLFIGKTIADTVVRYFEVVPSKGKENVYSLSYFNDRTGFSASGSREGMALTAEIVSAIKAPITKPSEEPKPTAKQAVVKFRTADISRVRIRLGNQLLFESKLPVYQLGFEEAYIFEPGR